MSIIHPDNSYPTSEKNGDSRSETPASLPTESPAAPQLTAVTAPVGPPPAKPGVWGGWTTVGFGAAIFAIYFVTQSIVAIVFTVTKLINNPSLPAGQAISALSSDGLLISIVTIVSAIAGTGFIILFIHIRKGPGIADYLGFKSMRSRTYGMLALVILGLAVLSFIADYFFNTPRDTSFTVDAYQTSRWPVLLGIAVVLFAPVFEECFFRGFVFVGLRASKVGAVGAIVLTALAWALLHLQYDVYGMTTIFVLGIVFGIVRLKTGSLWSTLILHMAWNLIAIVAVAVSS